MINATIIINILQNVTSSNEILKTISNTIYIPSIALYWLFQFILTLSLGLIYVRKDLGKFWGIFILTQLIGLIVLFFIFIVPIIPNIVSSWF